jgi:hypothetical protein
MRYFLLVVEGAHDAAFFGLLLTQRHLRKVKFRSNVDPYWERLIPTQFPSNPKGKLDHVVRFPDIYTAGPEDGDISVAIVVAESDSKLVSELRAALEILDITQLRASAVVSDADNMGVNARVQQLLAELNQVNAEAVRDSVRGFPLTLPAAPGFANGAPRIGIHVLPDNNHAGTLETVLLDCAVTSYSSYRQPAIDFVEEIATSAPANLPELAPLRRGAGREKAAAGAIGNLLFPAASLAVAIERGNWLQPVLGTESGLIAARSFLDSLVT